MQDTWMQDVEGQLSELNLRLADETLDEAERDSLMEQEDKLLARRKTYQAAPTGGDRGTNVQGLKDELNATQERLAALDATPPAASRPGRNVERSQDGRLQHNVEREQTAAYAADLERRLEYAHHDDEGLAAVLEDAEVRVAELGDRVRGFHPSDVRGKKALRERQAAQLKVGEIAREQTDRQRRTSVANLAAKTVNATAIREATAEWKKARELKIAEAALRISDGDWPAWKLAQVKEEAKGPPPPEFLEAKRREVAERNQRREGGTDGR
jgi:hypothetical protein